MKYFTFDEFSKSETATLRGINNNIPEEIKSNIEEFVDNILDPMREEWGSGIRITSGYRSPSLNRALNGSPTSVHPLGLAVDIVPCNGNMRKFQSFVEEFLRDMEFDQLIFEKPRNGIASWVHIGYKNSNGYQRKQTFTLV